MLEVLKYSFHHVLLDKESHKANPHSRGKKKSDPSLDEKSGEVSLQKVSKMEGISMTISGNNLSKKASAKAGTWTYGGAEGHRLVTVTLPAKETMLPVKYSKSSPTPTPGRT